MNDGFKNHNSILSKVELVVAENIKDRVRVLDREVSLKSKRHSPTARLTGMPTTCLGRLSRKAQHNGTQGFAVQFRKNYHRLLLGEWSVLILTGKELRLTKEAKKYHFDIVGVSSTKRCSSGIVNLNDGWKLCRSLLSYVIKSHPQFRQPFVSY